MSTVIELLAQADKVAVELHPLDAVHAEATRELAELEARIDGARAKAKAALDAKADLSARFEALVSELAESGVDRGVVERMVSERIAFLIQLGALTKSVPVATAQPVVPEPLAAKPKSEAPKAEEPVAPAASIQVAPTVPAVEPDSVESVVTDSEDSIATSANAPISDTVPEPETVELPALRLGAVAESGVSPIPASRQRRPRIAPVADTVPEPAPSVVETPASAAEVPVDAIPDAEVNVADPGVSPKAYLNVVGALDLDSEDDAGEDDSGAGSIHDEGEPAEEGASPREETDLADAGPALAGGEAEAEVQEPAKTSVASPPADEGAFIPAFLR